MSSPYSRSEQLCELQLTGLALYEAATAGDQLALRHLASTSSRSELLNAALSVIGLLTQLGARDTGLDRAEQIRRARLVALHETPR